jgi:hypothetical protein
VNPVVWRGMRGVVTCRDEFNFQVPTSARTSHCCMVAVTTVLGSGVTFGDERLQPAVRKLQLCQSLPNHLLITSLSPSKETRRVIKLLSVVSLEPLKASR